MMRLKTVSLAVLGTAAIVGSVLASPAMAEGAKAKGTMAKETMAKETMVKGTMAKGAKHTQAQTLAKGQRHASYRSQRIRGANAALPREPMYRRPAGPGEVAGAVVGGAVATAGAIATAPFQAADNSYNNYYGYGHGGRDWQTYAKRNNLACTPGTTFKGPDGAQHPCQ